MPMQPVPFALPFSRGVDTRTDARAVPAPYLLQLINASPQPGAIRKRPGTTSLPTGTSASAAIAAAGGLGAYKNELLLFDDQHLYSYGPSAQQWIDRGPAASYTSQVADIVRNTAQQTFPDSATTGGVTVYAWQDSRGGIRASVVDNEAGLYYQADVPLSTSANAVNPVCVAVGTAICVLWGDESNLWLARLNARTPTAFDPPKILRTDLSLANPWCVFDAAPYSDTAAVLAYATATTQVTVMYLTTFGYVGDALNGYVDPVSFDADATLVSLCADGPYVHLAYRVPELHARKLSSTLTSIWGPVTVDSGDGRSYGLAGIVSGSQVTWFYDIAIDYLPTVKSAVLNTGSGDIAAAASNLRRGVRLCSKPFTHNGRLFVFLGYMSSTQGTYFCVDATSNTLVGCNLSYVAGTVPDGYDPFGDNAVPPSTRPGVSMLRDGVFAWAGLRKGNLQSSAGGVHTLTGVSQIRADFTPLSRFSMANMGQQCHLAGGVVRSYDGAQLTEHAFLLYPDDDLTSWQIITGGNIVAGTYLYQTCYEWLDTRGQIHRSSPSIINTITLAESSTINWTLPTLRMTDKANVSICLYRTQVDNTVPYKIATLANDTTVDTVTWTDNSDDLSIGGNELLYTFGGELPNDPPPPASAIAATKSRVLLAGTEDPDVIWYSKEQVYGQGVSFSQDLNLRVNPTGGPITALAYMDDKVVVFKQTSILYFAGSGPDATGENNQFTDVELISSDVGCANPASIVWTTDGLFFQSDKGIYLLDRGFGLTYVGAPVEAYNGYTITSAVLLPDASKVHFTTADGPCLVYNYAVRGAYALGDQQLLLGQWSTYDNYSAAGACIWQGAYTFAESGGKVRQQNSTFTDDGLHVPMTVQTAWIATGQAIQGFGRAMEALLLGAYKNDHQLMVSVAYDYQNYPSSVMMIDTRQALYFATFGGDDFFGQNAVFGGISDAVYQFRSRLEVQQCEVMQFTLTDVAPAGVAPGESCSLTALTSLLVPADGLMRLPETKNF